MVNIDEIVAQSVAAHNSNSVTEISNIQLCFSPDPNDAKMRVWARGWDRSQGREVTLTQDDINALRKAKAVPEDAEEISAKLSVRRFKGWVLRDGVASRLPEIKLPAGWGLN